MMKKQSGFTLIEIVMVLVLLGILTAVAVPKYFDLQAEAAANAAATYAAEYQAQINANFAKSLLEGKTCTQARKAAINAVNSNTGLVNASGDNAVTKGAEEGAKGAVTLKIKVKGTEFPRTGDTDSQKAKFTIQLPTCSKEDS